MRNPSRAWWIATGVFLGLVTLGAIIKVANHISGRWKPNTVAPTAVAAESLEVELTGKQWEWIIRYPGADRAFGKLDRQQATAENKLGIMFGEGKSAGKDDFTSDTLVLCKDMPVHLRIRSVDVLHSVYLPHFRVVMNAAPGMETHADFVPTVTTAEQRTKLLAKGDSSQVIAEHFDFVLLCNKICGRGHYEMKRTVLVLPKDEYMKWFSKASKRTVLGGS